MWFQVKSDLKKRRKSVQQNARRQNKRLCFELELKSEENSVLSDDSMASECESNESVFDEVRPIKTSKSSLPIYQQDVSPPAKNNHELRCESNVVCEEVPDNIWKRIDEIEEHQYFSESDSDCDDTDGNVYCSTIEDWANECGIKYLHVTKLLQRLRKCGLPLPAQASTLMKLPRGLAVSKISGMLLICLLSCYWFCLSCFEVVNTFTWELQMA